MSSSHEIFVLYLASLRGDQPSWTGKSCPLGRAGALYGPVPSAEARQCSYRPPESWGGGNPICTPPRDRKQRAPHPAPPYKPPAGEGRQGPAPHPELHPVSPWAPPPPPHCRPEPALQLFPASPARQQLGRSTVGGRPGPLQPLQPLLQGELQRESSPASGLH